MELICWKFRINVPFLYLYSSDLESARKLHIEVEHKAISGQNITTYCIYQINYRVKTIIDYMYFYSSELFWMPFVRRPSICPSVRLSVIYSHFIFSRTTGAISAKFGTKHPWVMVIQICSNEGPRPFLFQGEIITKWWKYTDEIWKSSSEPLSQFQLNLVQSFLRWREFMFVQMKNHMHFIPMK